MNNIFFPEDDPDKSEDQNKPKIPTLPSKPAFEYSDDNEFDNLRQAMARSDSGLPIFSNSDSENQSFIEADPSLFNSDDNQLFSAFNDPNLGGETDSSSPQSDKPNNETGNNSPGLIQSFPWDQISGAVPKVSDIPSQVDTLLSTSDQNNPDLVKVTPPFVVEGDFDFAGKNFSTAEQVRRGVAPAETIELLITETMSEDEVIKISKELGIDWNLTPGDNREDRTQFLINYFKNKEFNDNRGAFIDNLIPQFESIQTEENWRESDSRLQALQESLNLPDSGKNNKKKGHLLSRLNFELDQSSKFVRGLTLGLSIIALTLAIVISYLYINFYRPAPKPAEVVVTQINPYPILAQLPGGWLFNLQVGKVKNGNWDPTGPEWLEGTEICRLISLPWSKQLDAVIVTFTTEDEIKLVMNNNDILTYQVESIKTIQSSELNQLTNVSTPSLVIVLAQKDTDVRQVILAKLTSKSVSPGGIGTEMPGATSTP